MPTRSLLASFNGFSDLKYSPVSDLLLQPKNDQYTVRSGTLDFVTSSDGETNQGGTLFLDDSLTTL